MVDNNTSLQNESYKCLIKIMDMVIKFKNK